MAGTVSAGDVEARGDRRWHRTTAPPVPCTLKSAVEAERVQTEPRPKGCGQGLVTAKAMSEQTEVIRDLDRRLSPAVPFDLG